MNRRATVTATARQEVMGAGVAGMRKGQRGARGPVNQCGGELAATCTACVWSSAPPCRQTSAFAGFLPHTL